MDANELFELSEARRKVLVPKYKEQFLFWLKFPNLSYTDQLHVLKTKISTEVYKTNPTLSYEDKTKIVDRITTTLLHELLVLLTKRKSKSNPKSKSGGGRRTKASGRGRRSYGRRLLTKRRRIQ